MPIESALFLQLVRRVVNTLSTSKSLISEMCVSGSKVGNFPPFLTTKHGVLGTGLASYRSLFGRFAAYLSTFQAKALLISMSSKIKPIPARNVAESSGWVAFVSNPRKALSYCRSALVDPLPLQVDIRQAQTTRRLNIDDVINGSRLYFGL